MPLAQRVSTAVTGLQAPAYPAGGRSYVRRGRRGGERQTKTKRVAVVLSLFLAFLAVMLLAGGRAVIDPLLKAAAVQRQNHRMGDIVFTMRDGTLCRHLSFDNKTAELIEGAVRQCASDGPAENPAASKGFAWGAH
jgi:hypothetical protein